MRVGGNEPALDDETAPKALNPGTTKALNYQHASSCCCSNRHSLRRVFGWIGSAAPLDLARVHCLTGRRTLNRSSAISDLTSAPFIGRYLDPENDFTG